MNNIFVGNLSFQATKEDLIKLFEPFGAVANAVIMERKKGKSRGYGFVDMPNEEEKNAAIIALQGKEFMWRVLSVSVVIPKVKSEIKKDREPRPTSKPPRSPKPYRRDDQAPRTGNTSEAASKYYSKFDGPPKPWRKGTPDSRSHSKPFRKDDKGSRPYYGKKDRDSKGSDKKEGTSNFYSGDAQSARPSASKSPYKKFSGRPKSFPKPAGTSKLFNKPGKGFKMAHKVSGASRPKSTDGL